jgi:PPM family protein phosphatase
MHRTSLFGASECGQRASNQDAFLARSFTNGLTVLAVADGMGGLKGGEIASSLAIEAVLKTCLEFQGDTGPAPLKTLLSEIFEDASQLIIDETSKDPSLLGMGTTLSCMIMQGNRCAWANLGDSRIYRLRNGEMDLLTVDHTYVQSQIQRYGEIAMHEAARYSHILEKALDGSPRQPDLFPIDSDAEFMREGDLFLLCTDGLIADKVETDTQNLAWLVIGTKDLEAAAEELISHALESGSSDNITVVLAEHGSVQRVLENHDTETAQKRGNLVSEKKAAGAHAKMAGQIQRSGNYRPAMVNAKSKRKINPFRDFLLPVAILLLISIIGVLAAEQLGFWPAVSKSGDTERISQSPEIQSSTQGPSGQGRWVDPDSLRNVLHPTTKDEIKSEDPNESAKKPVIKFPDENGMPASRSKTRAQKPDSTGTGKVAIAIPEASGKDPGLTPAADAAPQKTGTTVPVFAEDVADFDGNLYKTVVIGKQIWMAENLRTVHFNDGVPIAYMPDARDWQKKNQPGYCWYGNNIVQNRESDGALYNWYVVNSGKLCPAGYHVPSDKEWLMLELHLGFTDEQALSKGFRGLDQGEGLKKNSVKAWNLAGDDRVNSTGFSAIPGGVRNGANSYYNYRNADGFWWTSTPGGVNASFFRQLSNKNGGIGRDLMDHRSGMSVRCVKDE